SVEGADVDCAGVALVADEQAVAGLVVGHAGGAGGETGQGDVADEAAVEVGFNQARLGRMRDEEVAVAGADGDVAAADGQADAVEGEVALDAAGGAIDDKEAVSGVEPDEKVIGK